MDNEINKLQRFLEGIQSGPVSKDLQDELKTLVASCWEEFEGSTESRMAAYKVHRMENPEWDPPILSFKVERHGGTALGSTRAELQGWALNLNEGQAIWGSWGYRQVHPRAAPWKAEPVGEELAQLILNGEEDPRLKWRSEGKVEVQTSSIIPDYQNSPKETKSGRRRRLFASMERLLEPAGWQRSRNIWQKNT